MGGRRVGEGGTYPIKDPFKKGVGDCTKKSHKGVEWRKSAEARKKRQ